MKKVKSKLTKELSVLLVFALMTPIIVGLGGMNYVLAQSNIATQQASSGKATTISVVGKVADTAVTAITFPEGAPGATISNPYNDVDDVSDPQFLDSTASEPVTRLKNVAGVTYNVTLEITTWTNGVVASEDYELVDTGTTNIATVAQELSSDGEANIESTGISIGAGTYKALYLETVLSGVANKIGTSTLTILGETV